MSAPVKQPEERRLMKRQCPKCFELEWCICARCLRGDV